MYWNNNRHNRWGRRRRGWGFLPFLFIFVFMPWFLFHHIIGFVFAIIALLIVFAVIRGVLSAVLGGRNNGMFWNSWSNWNQPNQSYYQPTQPQQPYYQPTQTQMPYYQPSQPQQSYDQGYQASKPAAQPETYQEGGQKHSYEQYEQPQAQYPQEMPPMQ